jgi:hypothetical protein
MLVHTVTTRFYEVSQHIYCNIYQQLCYINSTAIAEERFCVFCVI